MALNPNASEKPGIMPGIRYFSKEEEDDLASWRYKDLPEGKSEKGLRSAHSMTSILKRKEKSRFNLWPIVDVARKVGSISTNGIHLLPSAKMPNDHAAPAAATALAGANLLGGPGFQATWLSCPLQPCPSPLLVIRPGIFSRAPLCLFKFQGCYINRRIQQRHGWAEGRVFTHLLYPGWVKLLSNMALPATQCHLPYPHLAWA